MMLRHLKLGPSDVTPTPKLMESLYVGTCRCSKSIQRGEQIWYDPLTKKVECYTCGRSNQNNARNGVSSVADVDETQAVIDRINSLLHLPERSAKADAEIVTLTKRLRRLARTDKNALKYLRTGKEGNAFIVRYTGVCRKCRTTVEKGEAAVYINNAIICSKCGTA